MIEEPRVLSDWSRLFRHGQQEARRRGLPVLVSRSEDVPLGDLLWIFARSRSLYRDAVYWERPADRLALTAGGAAWTFTGHGRDRFAMVAADWSDLLAGAMIEGGAPLLLGGFSFDQDQGTATKPENGWTGKPSDPAKLWQDFPAGRMILPRFLLRVQGDTCRLTVNVVLEPANNGNVADPAAELQLVRSLLAESALEDHSGPLAGYGRGGLPSARHHPPQGGEDRPVAAWKDLVADAVAAIQCGRAEKIVLARMVERQGWFRPEEALARLRVSHPACAIFALARDDSCFLGATPEVLARVYGRTVQATCLAGTTRRGASEAEDRRLGDELLASTKDGAEHEVVVRTVREKLAACCTGLILPPRPDLVKLATVQHLHTPITGHLRPDETLLSVVDRLHPTPALGGYPEAMALDYIRSREDLDRGWYAAPVGWIDGGGNGEFAAAIRSALLRRRRSVWYGAASLFVGCGIVADSDPASEYAESCLKLEPMLSALGELP